MIYASVCCVSNNLAHISLPIAINVRQTWCSRLYGAGSPDIHPSTTQA